MAGRMLDGMDTDTPTPTDDGKGPGPAAHDRREGATEELTADDRIATADERQDGRRPPRSPYVAL